MAIKVAGTESERRIHYQEWLQLPLCLVICLVTIYFSNLNVTLKIKIGISLFNNTILYHNTLWKKLHQQGQLNTRRDNHTFLLLRTASFLSDWDVTFTPSLHCLIKLSLVIPHSHIQKKIHVLILKVLKAMKAKTKAPFFHLKSKDLGRRRSSNFWSSSSLAAQSPWWHLTGVKRISRRALFYGHVAITSWLLKGGSVHLGFADLFVYIYIVWGRFCWVEYIFNLNYSTLFVPFRVRVNV